MVTPEYWDVVVYPKLLSGRVLSHRVILPAIALLSLPKG